MNVAEIMAVIMSSLALFFSVKGFIKDRKDRKKRIKEIELTDQRNNNRQFKS